MTTNPQPITLEQAMDLADHASPAPWIASQALKAMRAEISRLTASEPADYQRWVEFNWNRLGFERETNELRELFIMSVGIGGEAGEVQELLKKHVRDGREIRDDLRLELGDVLHYLTRIAAQFGMTLGEIMLANREKIERRHAKRCKADPTRTAEDDQRDLGIGFTVDGVRVDPQRVTVYGGLVAARVEAAAHPADEAEIFIQAAIDRAPEPLRRLGEFLTRVLDDDKFATAERMLLGACEAMSPEAGAPDGMALVPERFVETVRAAGRDGVHPRAVPHLIAEALDMLSTEPEASSHD